MYLAIGGMPAAINKWIEAHQSRAVKKVHRNLLVTYEKDFRKYAKKHQIKYLNLIFLRALEQLGDKFVYSNIGYNKRELAPAMELLEKAGLLYQVIRSSGQGIPIGAQADPDYFKILFLDVGLTQALLKLNLAQWFIEPMATLINKGEIVEAFVGQELLAYSDPISKETLFYWARESRSSQAEIDYLIQINEHVIPVEVKSGKNRKMRSMPIFFESHPNSPYGIRFWASDVILKNKIRSFPLYAVARPLIDSDPILLEALMYLTEATDET